jgi:hypothetical protein
MCMRGPHPVAHPVVHFRFPLRAHAHPPAPSVQHASCTGHMCSPPHRSPRDRTAHSLSHAAARASALEVGAGYTTGSMMCAISRDIGGALFVYRAEASSPHSCIFRSSDITSYPCLSLHEVPSASGLGHLL